MQIKNNIPTINDKFDLYVFWHIVKKSKWIILTIFAITSLLSLVYLRYTSRLYEASSIIQVNNENSSAKLLGVEKLYEEDELAQNIELLASKQFLTPILQTLPLRISYFNKGTFLAQELYKNTPIEVSYNITNQSIIDKPIYFKYINSSVYQVSFEEGVEKTTFEGYFNKNLTIDGAVLNIKILNADYFKNMGVRNDVFFRFNSPTSIYKTHIKGLSVQAKSYGAKTIEIKYTGKNALKSADIVNAIAKGYLQYEIDKKKASSTSILSFIDKQTNLIYKDLNKTEQEIYTFKQENNIKDFETGIFQPVNIFMGKIKEFEDEVLKADIEIASLEQINKKLSKDDNISIFELIALISGVSSQNVIEMLLKDLQELSYEKDKLLNDVTDKNHKIIVINHQIEDKKKILKQLIIKTKDRLELQKNNYTKKIKEYEDKLLQESDYDQLKYASLQRYYAVQDRFYEKLIEAKAEYLISQAGYVSKNTILEEATAPRFPVTPNKKIILILSIVIATVVCIIYILVKYLFYNEISSVRELELYTQTPVIGSVPLIDMKNKYSQMVVHENTDSLVAEAFRTIRSNIDFYNLNSQGNLIAISSTVSGEGKTFVAINFAASLAMRNKKVIIIDLDLRKPKVHFSLGVKNEEGMSRLLSGHVELQEVIKHTELENFDYITADKTPPNPSELISSRKFDEVIENLQEQYDYIIIDTSPIGLVSDSIRLFRKADIPIYVLKANYSKRQFLYNIDYLREKKSISDINIVFNGIDFKSKRYGYYGHYGYGYGYGYGQYSEKHQKKSWFRKMFS